jgi:hypothetical protein
MRNIYKLLILVLLIAVSSRHVKAQHVVNEGHAVYSASYDIPADQLQNYGSLPSQIVIYFRGDSTAAIVNQGNAIIKGVSVFKTNYHSMIIDVPAAAKKIFVVMTPAEVAEDNAANPQFTAKSCTDKDIINGFKCTKTTITDSKTSQNYDIWLTNDVDIVPNSVSRPVSSFGGVPVKFVTFNHGIKINAELLVIEEDAVPKGFFSASKEYQPMSYEELKKLSGGK